MWASEWCVFKYYPYVPVPGIDIDTYYRYQYNIKGAKGHHKKSLPIRTLKK